MVEKIERDLQEKGDKEIKSNEIGERIMQALHSLDEVAYVRFASVYRQFTDISEFMAEVRELLSTKKNQPS
jgi:transcriptional repressor NrdR